MNIGDDNTIDLQNKQNICFTFDEAYDEVFFVVITSIIHNATNENKSKFNFFINYFGEINNIEILLSNANKRFPDNQFTFKHIPSEFPMLAELSDSSYDFTSAPKQIQTSSVFCRFFLASIYSDVKGYMIHMDLDMIVKADISELFEIAHNSEIDYPLFSCFNETINEACIEQPRKFQRKYTAMFNKNPKIKEKAISLGLLPLFEKEYKSRRRSANTAFNAGIFMFNLDIIRTEKFEKKFSYCMRINMARKIFRHNDQGILNFIFQDNAGKFPVEWNAMWFGCESKWSMEFFGRCIPQYAKGKLLHFNGPLKPWKELKTDHKEAQADWEYYQKLSETI